MAFSADQDFGLKTIVALARLHDDIEEIVCKYETEYEKKSWFAKFKYPFSSANTSSPINWFPTVSTLLCIVCLFLSRRNYTASLILLILLILAVVFLIREENLRRTEIYRKIRTVLAEIKVAETLCQDWSVDNYPNLCSPLSPCVTLQWTYRNGKIVNLPWALLVREDYIVMRPGQLAPGPCTEITGKRKFKCGETYGITQSTLLEPPRKPIARIPMPDLICIMESTPFLDNLKTSLDIFLTRPGTIYNQQRDFLITKCVQQWGVLLILFLTLVGGLMNYSDYALKGKIEFHWREIFLDLPAAAVLPILPLIFPMIWISINLWGVARLETLLTLPQPILQIDHQKSYNEDLDTPTYDLLENVSLPRRTVFRNWFNLIRVGSSNLLGRSSNIVQVLGSITALCCVDKKGILSWPNPTAEKVFFFRDSSADLSSDNSSAHSSFNSNESDKSNPQTNKPGSGAVAEVLDLTHDQHSPFKLEFDDHEWKNHIDSLKPLGLAILLNTCCQLTQNHYTKFCGHVTAVAMMDKNLVPVTNRYAIVESSLISFMHGRCLCELARQIGFTTQARNIFQMEGQISSYRHLQPDVVRRDIRFARSLQLAAKVKVPFPHSLSVVIRELPSGSLQLLTQGTADMVLDCCDDFWDGNDLRPLTSDEKKRAQDFYQRSALTAYCTAFSYRPLRHGICGALAGQNDVAAYLELPPESKTKHKAAAAPVDVAGCHNLNHSLSTDSLLFNDNKEEHIADVESCYEMQCHQVFIGMVTMQYQAQTDVVQLIERMERACIRFVHFSKENELRSRVFSEKMGLESGWNCHISLLSQTSENHQNNDSATTSKTTKIDDTLDANEDVVCPELSHLLAPSTLERKTLSSSAPGAISNEQNPVSNPSNKSSNESIEFVRKPHARTSRDSAMEDDSDPDGIHHLDENCRSLSCLTDTTEQSAPINFDCSNRAKLPRGIENIRPHLENIDNVPLLVSLFTDCSAEATKEMLTIMQQYGEIVVCLGSSASNANAEIFLQGDSSIAIEPLYPQVCQEFPAYSESNIYNNKQQIVDGMSSRRKEKCFPNKQSELTTAKTISPVYLSRILNSIPCSISLCRDDPISIAASIELSRRFTIGLWNCVQFLICCGCTLAIINTISACLFLPPMFTPLTTIYLMCVAFPVIAVALVRIEPNNLIMNRATGKKQTTIDSNLFIFAMWCYGCKFLPSILILLFSYCSFLSHPVIIIDNDDENFLKDLELARIFLLYSIIVHVVTISITFVHRDYLMWAEKPFSNLCWLACCLGLILIHTTIVVVHILTNDYIVREMERIWPILLFLILSTVLTLTIAELCKWQEIKANTRYQRRARLDFGTKLGMNSPF